MYNTNQIQVLNGWGQWLNAKEWNFFCTFTTRYSLSLKSARRAMERLYNFLSAKYGNVRLFWVAEPFDTRHSYHTHALIYFTNPLIKNLKPLLIKAWQVVSGGKGGKEFNNTVLKPYDKTLGANYYLGKYMMRNNTEYNIEGDYS